MNLYFKYIFVIAGLLLANSFTLSTYARINQNRGELLGGGGTNFSDRKVDRNGLLTGIHSEVRHLFGLYADGAYSTVFFTNPNLCTIPIGHAYGGGICYDFQYYYLKIQVGIGVKMQRLMTHVKDMTIDDDYVSDAWGYPYHLKYEFRDRLEYNDNLRLQIPLLLGSGTKNVYAMAGIKIDLNAYSKTSITAIGSTTGTYGQFSGLFEEMDNHGLRKDVPIEFYDKQKNCPINVLASFEIGGEWGTAYKPIVSRYRSVTESSNDIEWRVRAAAFIDYGLLPINNMDKKLVDIPKDTKWDFCTFKMNNVLCSNSLHGSHLHNLHIGVKLTIFIGSLHYITCVICGDAQSEADMQNPIKKSKRRR